MFAHVHQYQHEQVADSNRTAGESKTEDSVNKDAEEYFGKSMDEFDIETWETVEYEGDPIQRRIIALDDVLAISVPETRPMTTTRTSRGGLFRFVRAATRRSSHRPKSSTYRILPPTERESDGRCYSADEPVGTGRND